MKKWSLWKTIVSVISGVVLVAGVTVGGIFLAGGFKEKKINPDAVSFNLDEDIYNSINSQFEVTKDFTITISGTTNSKDVINQTEVMLSLNDGNYTEDKVNGVVYDSVITVPRKVTLGKPFMVKLNMSPLKDENGAEIRDGGNIVPWISGGLSKIVATSQNPNIQPISVKVAVDIPVYSMDIDFYDLAGNLLKNNEVTSFDTFSATAKFLPVNSEFAFSDNVNTGIAEKRRKLAYFESLTENVKSYFENDKQFFSAGEPALGNQIKGYAFRDAATQIKQIDQYILANPNESKENLYKAMLSYLAGVVTDNVNSTKNIDIVDATIENFVVSKAGATLNMTAGKVFTLSVNRSDYANDYLGTTILSANDENLVSLFKNVGLRFEYTTDDVIYQDATGLIDIEGGKLVSIEGANYHLPNSNVLNINDSNWKIYTANQIKLKVTAVLLLNLPDKSGYELFANESGVVTYEFALNAKESIESGLTWANSDTINMTLDFDGSNPKPASKPLGDLAIVPEENVYKTVVFFAFFGARDEAAVKAIIGDNYEHAGKYQLSNGEFMLYPLKDKEITVTGTGEFEIYFATVLTDKHDTSIFDAENRYIIVKNIEDPVKVVVSKTLYENSITAVDFDTDATMDVDNNYYINNGASNEITLTFAINQDSYEVFKEKVNNGAIDLDIFATEINITNFFDIGKVVLDDNNKSATYTLKPKVSFSSGDMVTTSDITLSSVMLTDNTTFGNNLLVWAFSSPLENKYIFYTSKIDKVEFLDNITLDYSKTVQVVQNLQENGDYSISISYFSTDGQEHEMNDPANWLGQFNIIAYDQHGKTDIFSDDWSYSTDNASLILISSDGKEYTFPTAKGTATLRASCSDGTSTVESANFITFDIDSSGVTKYKFDESKTPTSSMIENAKDFNGSAIINKFGASGSAFILSDFVKLYLDAEATKLYLGKGFTYSFSQQFIGGLSDEDFDALFVGAQSMISVFDDGNRKIDVANKASLSTDVKISRVETNHNFASAVSLSLIMSDENVNVNVTLNILNNVVEISGNTNVGAAESDKLYAASEKAFANNITIKFQNGEKLLSDILFDNNGNGYLISDENGNYKIVFENPGNYIALITKDGNVLFNDFWDDEVRTYTNVKIHVDESGPYTNKFSPFIAFNFTVRRNLQIVSKDNTYKYNVTDEQTLDKYITIRRIEGDKSIDEALKAYDIQTNNYINIVEKKLVRSATNIPVFGYNQDSFFLNVIVKIGDAEISSIPVKFTSGLNYNDLANKLMLGTKHATTELVGDVNYIYITNAEWTLTKEPSLKLIAKYNDVLNSKIYEPGFYSVQELDTTTNVVKLSISQVNTPLFGLNNTTKYMIFKLSNAAGSQDLCIMIVPVIVTSMGDLLTVYQGASSSLQTSLSSTNDLIKEGKFLTLSAGGEYTIATPYTEDAPIIADPATGKYDDGIYYLNKGGRSIQINEIASTGYKYGVVANIVKDATTQAYKIKINNLSTEFSNVYVTLEIKININGNEQKYYYLIKITPSVKVNQSIYPFIPKGESGVEYISAEVGKSASIDLTEAFDSSALNAGSSRFSISLGSEDIGNNFSKYPFTHSIVSVYDGINTLTSPQEYLALFEILGFEGNKLIVKPKVNSVLTITIKRHYETIICNDINYVLILNGSSNFKMDYSASLGNGFTQDPNNANNAVWSVSQGQPNYEATINMRDMTNSGESSTGNIIYNRMKASFAIMKKDVNAFAEGEETDSNETLFDGVGTFKFDSSIGKLTYIPADYVGEDYVINVNFYTEQGHVGSVTINIQSSIAITFKTTELMGGKTINILNDLVKSITDNSSSQGSYDSWVVDMVTDGTVINDVLSLSESSMVSYSNGILTALTSAQEQKENLTIILKRARKAEASDALPAHQTYKFNIVLTIKANILNEDGSAIASVGNAANAKLVIRKDTSPNVYAQNNLEIAATEILKGAGSDTISLDNALYSCEAISGGEAMNETGSSVRIDKIVIKTQDVAVNTRLQVRIKIELFKDKTDISTLYQTFYVNYEAIIYANVKIDFNYPNPTGIAALQSEYLDDGATFATANDFVNGKASFASANRMVITPLATGSSIVQKTKVSISDINNVTMKGNGVELSNQDGNNIIYTSGVGEEINITNLTFTIKNNDGTEAYVVFRVECNQVVKLYTVRVQKDVYSLQVNTANRNYNSLDHVESFYLDELASHRNIFEENRLLNFTLNSDLESNGLLSSTYKLLFKDTTIKNTWEGYRVATIKFNAKEQGQAINLDLGQSFKNFTFKGIYTGDITGKLFGNNVDVLTLADDGNFKYSDGSNPSTTQTAMIISGDSSKIIFNVQPKLLSRIELKYAGNKIDYDMADAIFGFKNNKNDLPTKLSTYVVEQDSSEIDTVLKLGGLGKEFTITLANGQQNNITEFGTVNYDYKVSLDIGIAQALEFNSENNSISLSSEKDNQIFVSQDADFLYRFGAFKPSQGSGSYLTKDHFKQEGVSMKLGIIGLTSGYDFDDSDPYHTAITEIYSAPRVLASIKEPYYNGNVNNRYLAIAGELYGTENKTINYNVSGIGAANLGQFVLLKFTYTVTIEEEFSKDFYIMVEVLPDYKIAFAKAGETSAFDDEGNLINGGKITNQDSAPSIMPTLKENTSEYEYKQDATLIAGNKDYAMVSVKHGKSDNQRELSANNFTYTLMMDDREVNGIEYNKTANVNNKLKGLLNVANHWTNTTDGSGNITSDSVWKNSADNAQLSIYGVKEVIFGSQNYRMTAQDNYGFTFTVCWTLQSRFKDPEFDGTKQIREGTQFDIGAQYEKLSVNQTQAPDAENVGKFDIANEVNMNVSTRTVFNVMNIEAWAFDKAYVNGENIAIKLENSVENVLAKASIENKPAGYSVLGGSYVLGDGKDTKYLATPNINYVSIAGVKYLDVNNQSLAEIKPSLGQISFGALRFGSSSELEFNGIQKENFGTTTFEMPTFGGYVYGEEGNAEMTMVVTLRYEKGDNTEEFDVKVPITVTKEIDINSAANNIVRDGDAIVLDDYINVIRDNNKVKDVAFYDDTLEFHVSPLQQVKFKLTAQDGGATYENPEITLLNNNSQRERIFYQSISSLVGRTLTKNATFDISVLNQDKVSNYDNFKVKYNGIDVIRHTKGQTPPEPEIWETTSVKIADSVSAVDKVVVEDSYKFGSSKKLALTKYYLVSVTDNAGNNPKEYQFAQDYVVTPYYYSLSRNYSGNEKKVEDYIEKENSMIEMPLQSWTKGMTLNKLIKGGGIESELTIDTFSQDCIDKLYFVVNAEDKTGSSPAIGAVTIDENGTIKTTSAFDKSSHYVVVKIYVKASGMNGAFNTPYASDQGILLDTIRLSLYMYDDATQAPLTISQALETHSMVLNNGTFSVQKAQIAAGEKNIHPNAVNLSAGVILKTSEETSNNDYKFAFDREIDGTAYYKLAGVEVDLYIDANYTKVEKSSVTTVTGGVEETKYIYTLKLTVNAPVYINVLNGGWSADTANSNAFYSVLYKATNSSYKVFVKKNAGGMAPLYGILNSLFIVGGNT